MKTTILALLLIGFAQFAIAEDSVECDRNITVAWTDDSTISVYGFRSNDELRGLEILQRGDSNYVRIENNRTVIRNVRLLKVRVSIDNGTSVRTVMIFDWDQFEDGAMVPVEVFHQYPNGDLEFREKIECSAAQS